MQFKKVFALATLLLAIGCVAMFFLNFDTASCILYDLTNDNPTISSNKQLWEKMNGFEKVKITALPKDYLAYSKLDSKKYAPMVSGMEFYVLEKKDCYQKIVGDYRIKDFVARDKYYKNAAYFSDNNIYWGIDGRVLVKLLELRAALAEKGCDQNAINVNYGHRTPKMNEDAKGASKSRHIKGEAIDMVIGDIDKNGVYTSADKAIVLDLCERNIIKDQGGIGKYPGTRVVHIDVRGYRARWDTF